MEKKSKTWTLISPLAVYVTRINIFGCIPSVADPIFGSNCLINTITVQVDRFVLQVFFLIIAAPLDIQVILKPLFLTWFWWDVLIGLTVISERKCHLQLNHLHHVQLYNSNDLASMQQQQQWNRGSVYLGAQSHSHMNLSNRHIKHFTRSARYLYRLISGSGFFFLHSIPKNFFGFNQITVESLSYAYFAIFDGLFIDDDSVMEFEMIFNEQQLKP